MNLAGPERLSLEWNLIPGLFYLASLYNSFMHFILLLYFIFVISSLATMLSRNFTNEEFFSFLLFWSGLMEIQTVLKDDKQFAQSVRLQSGSRFSVTHIYDQSIWAQLIIDNQSIIFNNL